jgi:hypothetical protein
MKISEDKNYVEHDFDIVSLIEDLKKQYRTIYWFHEDGDIYIYKPLGRKDYKDICENEELSIMDKEDEVIKKCLLYPDPNTFDLDDMVAGVSEKLFNTIMQNSFLVDINSKQMLMDYYRSEMYDLQNQITCLINEAFPQFDIEDIENWDIERTSKYLSRAEWKLQNLRGMTFDEEYFNRLNNESSAVNEDVQPQQVDSGKMNESNKKPALDRAKLEELKRKIPEIDWEHDTITMEGIKGMRDRVDTSPALTPGI